MPDEMLRFRRVTTGRQNEIAATARVDEVEFPAGEFLRARAVWLKDGHPRRLRAAPAPAG